MMATAGFDAGVGKSPLLQHCVGQIGERPGDARCLPPSQRRSISCTVDDATPTRHESLASHPGVLQSHAIAHMARRILSIGIGTLLGKAKKSGP